jgi:hypothetical protein
VGRFSLESGRLNYKLMRAEIFGSPQLLTKSKVFVNQTSGLLFPEEGSLKFTVLATNIACPCPFAPIGIRKFFEVSPLEFLVSNAQMSQMCVTHTLS